MARAHVPLQGLATDSCNARARPAAGRRLGNRARLVGRDTFTELPTRHLAADLSARTCPAATRRLGKIASGAASAEVLTGPLAADLSDGATPATRGRLGNDARLVRPDTLAGRPTGHLAADLSSGTSAATRGRLRSQARIRRARRAASTAAAEGDPDLDANLPRGTVAVRSATERIAAAQVRYAGIAGT